MNQLASFSLFLFRLLLTSTMALCCQIFLIVKYPDYLLVVQEAVKKFASALFQSASLNSSYRVAYNLINGDGIIVHTVFVLMAFIAIYLVVTPLRIFRR